MTNRQPPPPTPLQQTFINIANRSFNTNPYLWQYGMGGFAIETTAINAPFKFICIRPTSGGKSLLYQVLALHFKKVTLCITPILALGSDQMQKIAKVPDLNLIAFHMDELNDDQVIKLKRHLEILHPDNTVILLASLLFLYKRGKQFLEFLFRNDLIKMIRVY